MERDKGGRRGDPHICRASRAQQVRGCSSPRGLKPLNFSPLRAPCCFLIPAFSLPDKRPTTSSSFTGFQAPLLARRDSSLKRLTRWGSRDNKTPSPSSSDQQKSLNGEEDASSSASASEEDKLDLAPEN